MSVCPSLHDLCIHLFTHSFTQQMLLEYLGDAILVSGVGMDKEKYRPTHEPCFTPISLTEHFLKGVI